MMSISRDRDTNSTSEHPGGEVSASPRDDLRPVILSTVHDGAILRAALKCISVVGSIALHAGAAAAMLVWLEPKPGVISMATEAITVELVASDVIEAMTLAPLTVTSAVANAPDVRAGNPDEAPARQETDKIEPAAAEPTKEEAEEMTREPPREAAEAPQQADEAPSESQPADEVPVQIAKLDEALIEVVPREEETPAKPDRKPEPEAAAVARPKNATPMQAEPRPQTLRQKTEREPSRKGGTPSRAQKASHSSPARASASAGDAINYAAIVRARVASRRPTGPGQRGTVQITFGVSPSGALSFASVSRSSGDPSLDRNVLAAVRGAAPFPPPPAGASPRQRSFSVPFYFQ